MSNLQSSDPYEVLGIDPHCTDEELKKRYHELAQQFHPDKGGKEDDFKLVSQAYQKILNRPRINIPPFRMHPLYPNDESFIVAQISATIAEIKRGKHIELVYNRSYACLACNGTIKTGEPPCKACMGHGYFTKTEHLTAVLKGEEHVHEA